MAKKLILSFSILLFSGCLIFGQNLPASKVPPSVRSAFNRTNSGTSVQWTKGNHGSFEAQFRSAQGNNFVYVYDVSGRLLNKKKSISSSAVPAAVQAEVNGKFKNPSIKDAYQVIAGSNRYYELNVVTSTSRENLKMSSSGNILAQNSKPLPGSSNTAIASSSSTSQPMASAEKPETMRGETTTTNYDDINLDELDDFDIDSELDDLLNEDDFDMDEYDDLDDVDSWLDDEEDDLDEFDDDDL